MRALSLILSSAFLSMAAFSDASAIPAWARRYNVNCSHCHAPAVPRLNATGIRFRWAGYRMPEDIGQQVTVERVQNYLSVRGRMRYNYAKTEGQPASNSSFAFNDATIFYSGPFGKNYGAVFEFERAAEDNVELVAQIQSAWGTETSYWGFRFGQMHWLLREGLAGFDRPTGISTPLPVNNALTGGGIPFAFGNDQLGGEAYYMAGRNRISAQVLNGINSVGKGDEGDPDTKKDFVITDQYLLDEAGSGITAVGYYGTLLGADAAAPSATSHFWRLGLSASKIVNNFEVMGTVIYGKDSDLPVVGGGAFATPTVSGLGYWVYGGYTLRKGGADAEGSTPLTLFGRYEYADPNSDVSNNAKTRFLFGGVLPVSMPEYLRLALEYTLTTPQGGGLKQHGLSTELMLNF